MGTSEAKHASFVKKLLPKLAALAGSTLVTLVIVEIFLRIFFPQQEAMQWFQSDKRYGFLMKQNFHQDYHYTGFDFAMEVKTNSMGLRDREYDLADTQKKRVLLIGDSYVFGYGVQEPDNFDNQLERLLNRNGDHWMVINAGHGGWGTYQATEYANDHLELFKPDVVVLTFCENDPSDDDAFLSGQYDSEKGQFYFPGKIALRNNSHLYRLVFYKYKAFSSGWAMRKQLATDKPGPDVFVDPATGIVISEKAWQRTLARIRDFHERFIKYNPHGLVLVQTSATLQPIIRQHLSSLSNEKTLVYVDLAAEVEKLKPDARVLPWDRHWSPAVHAISGRALFDTIQRLTPDETK